MEQKQPEVKKKGGRPTGYSPKVETKGVVVEDSGEFIIVKIPKKQLGKLILKDLI
jgi:hypothetical protein